MFATRVGFYSQTAEPPNLDAGYGQFASPGLIVYKWNDATGWGTKYANAAVTFADGFDASWHPAGTAIASSTSGELQLYNWISNVGFGTKITSPSGFGSWARYPTFSPDGIKLGHVAFRLTPYVYIYSWPSRSRWANPSTLPSSGGFNLAWNSQSNIVALNSENTPWMHAWTVSSTAWGTKFANPSNLSSAGVNRTVFHPSDTAVARTASLSPFVAIYNWSNSSGFGTLYSNPSTALATQSLPFWSPDGNIIFCYNGSSPFFNAYTWSQSTGFGTKFANPVSTSPRAPLDTRVSISGGALLYSIGGGTFPPSPYIQAMSWNNVSGFGTIYANPSVLVNPGQYGANAPTTKLV